MGETFREHRASKLDGRKGRRRDERRQSRRGGKPSDLPETTRRDRRAIDSGGIGESGAQKYRGVRKDSRPTPTERAKRLILGMEIGIGNISAGEADRATVDPLPPDGERRGGRKQRKRPSSPNGWGPVLHAACPRTRLAA